MFWKRKISDARLVGQVLSGKRDAYGVLFERHLPVVYAVSYAQVNNSADAEDISQEAFIYALKALDSLRQPEKFQQWIITIARRLCYRFLTKRARTNENLLEKCTMGQGASPDIGTRELHELLRNKIDALDADPREILLLYYFAGKKQREIADLLDISRGAVDKRLKRAREALGKSVTVALGDALEEYRPNANRKKQMIGLILAASVLWKGKKVAAASWLTRQTFTLKNCILGGVATAMLAITIFYTFSDGELTNVVPVNAAVVSKAAEPVEPPREESPETEPSEVVVAEEPGKYLSEEDSRELVAYILEEQKKMRDRIKSFHVELAFETFKKPRALSLSENPADDVILPPPRYSGTIDRIQRGVSRNATIRYNNGDTYKNIENNEYKAIIKLVEIDGVPFLDSPLLSSQIDMQGRTCKHRWDSARNNLNLTVDSFTQLYGGGFVHPHVFDVPFGKRFEFRSKLRIPPELEVWKRHDSAGGEIYCVKYIYTTYSILYEIDPQKGFLVTYEEGKENNGRNDITKVNGMRKLQDGIWFPVRMERKETKGGELTRSYDINIQKVTVNETYPDELFTVKAFGIDEISFRLSVCELCRKHDLETLAYLEGEFVHLVYDGLKGKGRLSDGRYVYGKNLQTGMYAHRITDVPENELDDTELKESISPEKLQAEIKLRAKGNVKIEEILSESTSVGMGGDSIEGTLSRIGEYVDLIFEFDGETVPNPEELIVEAFDVEFVSFHEALSAILNPLELDYVYEPAGKVILITALP